MKKIYRLLFSLLILISSVSWAADPSAFIYAPQGWQIQSSCSGITANGVGCWNGTSLCIGNATACVVITGDVSTINGLSVPTSKTVIGTNSSGQIVDASTSAPALAGTNFTGTAASLSIGGNAGTVTNGVYQFAAGSLTCIPKGGLNDCSVAAAVLNNGVITLPTATAGWPLRCEIESGDDVNSAYFTVASGGTASPISSSAGIVFNAVTASKVQVGAASPANPLVITNASGGTLNIWVACKLK